MGTSIRRRLTAWNALAFAAVLVGFAALVYLLVVRSLRQQADRTAETAFRLVETDGRLAANTDARARYWVHEFDEHMGVPVGIYRPDGAPVAVHPKLAEHFSGAPAAPIRLTHTDPAGDRWAVASKSVRAGERELVVLLLVPLKEADAELALLARVMAVAVPLALLASAGVAYLLARKALAPVDALRRSAAAITADRLHERLPVPNPDDELGKLAATVNAMIERLERSFAEVRRFTADASHELRTPLTAIRIEAEAALDRAATAEEYRALAGSVLEECGRMARLTDQLLALAREDAGAAHAEPVPVDLGELVGGVVEVLRPVVEARRLKLDAELAAGVVVRGDPVRLRQVAVNLIDNAAKYTPEGGSIRVTVARIDERAVLTVADTGEGIPAEHLPRVFDRFYRLDKARSREMGGTGLGLAIVKSIVTAHGGAVELTSTVGAGTTATVALPLRVPTAGE
ncbi:MAG: HAMP domain-containing protein [Planctomycetes bacterium]|nr:HAMP domain-containing protein [Planctomycetota bacterium]